MFVIKKSSLFFSKSILLQNCFYNSKILAFYDYFSLTSLDFFYFKNLILELNLGFFLLSSKFISFFFNFFFFKFLKPGVFLVFTNYFEEFLKFDVKIKNFTSFYLVAFSFEYLFFNYNNLNKLYSNIFEYNLFKLFFFFYSFFYSFFFYLIFYLYFFYLIFYIVFFNKFLI